MVRVGWYREVKVKSEERANGSGLFLSRDRAWSGSEGISLFSRAIGLQFRKQVIDLLGEDHQLRPVVDPLSLVHDQVCQQQRKFDDEIRRLAKSDETTRRLMTVPGVGVATALTFGHTVDDPSRFRSASAVGAYLGLTPRRNQSGEIDKNGRTSRLGRSTAANLPVRSRNCLALSYEEVALPPNLGDDTRQARRNEEGQSPSHGRSRLFFIASGSMAPRSNGDKGRRPDRT